MYGANTQTRTGIKTRCAEASHLIRRMPSVRRNVQPRRWSGENLSSHKSSSGFHSREKLLMQPIWWEKCHKTGDMVRPLCCQNTELWGLRCRCLSLYRFRSKHRTKWDYTMLSFEVWRGEKSCHRCNSLHISCREMIYSSLALLWGVTSYFLGTCKRTNKYHNTYQELKC